MGFKTVKNSSFQGLKKKAQGFVLSSVTTKSGFIATKSGFVARKLCHWLYHDKIWLCLVLSRQSLLLTLLRQNLVLLQESFVTGFFATKAGFVVTKLCHWLCRDKIC